MRDRRLAALYYRALKGADTLAYLGLLWLTWRLVDGELHWRLAAGAVALSGAWLALTFLRTSHLFKTYFDVLSRLEFVVPLALGAGLALLAALDGSVAATRAAALAELAAWGALLLLYRRNRRRYVRQGHGPVPVGCWVSPPAAELRPGDLILTSGRVAQGLRESVGHGEAVIRARDGALISLSSYMDRGALLHPVDEFTSSVRRHGHYIVLRLRAGLSPEQLGRAEEIARGMVEENRAWCDRVNRRRAARIARLPLPRHARERLARALHSSGYDWLGLFMGRLAEHRWTCIGACLELYRRLGVATNAYGTGLLGFGTSLLDPIMPVRFLSDPAFRLLTTERDSGAESASPS